jgi:hypothetical protein
MAAQEDRFFRFDRWSRLSFLGVPCEPAVDAKDDTSLSRIAPDMCRRDVARRVSIVAHS